MSTSKSYIELLDEVASLSKSVVDKNIQLSEISNKLRKSEEESKNKDNNVVNRTIVKRVEVKAPKPTLVVPMEGYNASLENGSWKYDPIQKSESSVATKPIYKDPVQFKIIEEYEGISKSRYQIQLGRMTIEIAKYLNGI